MEKKAMKPMKTRDAVLTLFGLVCLAAYILACRPAFSPDGSKILFSWVDNKTGWFTAALYDRKSQEVETIFNFGVRRKPGVGLGVVRWDPDGKRAIVVWPEEQGEEHIRVAVLPLGSKSPTHLFLVSADKKCESCLFIPPPVVGGQLFLAMESSVRRLDLQTGEIKTQDFGEELDGLFLAENRDQVYYLTQVKPQEAYEIGNIDKGTLARIPILRIEKKILGGISPFFAISKDGSRIAVVSELPPTPPSTDTLPGILIYHGKDLERAIWLGSQPNIDLGNSEWSLEGTTIYTAYLKKLEPKGEYEVGILEVSLDGTGVREISLFGLGDEDGKKPEAANWDFQISISPDGKTIAAFCSNFCSIKSGEDLALYLVDLTTPDHKVTRIPLPVAASPKPAPQEK